MAEVHDANLESNTNHPIFDPVQLPCGVYVPNKLVKVAMYEHCAPFLGGSPNDSHFTLYSAWSKGSWGMIITGNVQVCSNHLTLGRDLVLPDSLTPDALRPFAQLSAAIHGSENQSHHYSSSSRRTRALAIMQLSHAGRQSPLILGGRPPFSAPLGPSAVPLGTKQQGVLGGMLYSLLFQTPRAMTASAIDDVVDRFVRGARLAHASSFDGVQLHASHGYLLAQFISPKSNKRVDQYRAEGAHALVVIKRIADGIRAELPSNFVLGLKLNAADYASNEDSEARALDHLRQIASWGQIDFIEISGGDYENPEFMTTSMAAKSTRQAFFSRFSHQAVKTLDAFMRETQSKKPPPVVLLTGGLKSFDILSNVLNQGHAQLLGIGRASVLCPHLPRQLRESLMTQDLDDVDRSRTTSTFLREPLREPDLGLPGPVERVLEVVPLPKLIGAGVGMAWYTVQMRRIAQGKDIDYTVGPLLSVLKMWIPRRTVRVVLTGCMVLTLLSFVTYLLT